jgi:CheY-like chemotaxis protein
MNIFYIDDDPEDREFFVEAIEKMDSSYLCSTAKDGLSGLIDLQQLVMMPDFIFVDINMPVMNGKQFLIEIKKIPGLRSIPVIMYSTSCHPNEMQQYLWLGAFRVLVKPNSFDKVHELVSSIIENISINKQ